MEKLTKFLVVFVVCILVGSFVVGKYFLSSWTFSLPNGYEIRKRLNQSVVLGVVVDEKFVIDNYGVDSYIAEFQYNDRFVGVKIINESEEVSYYFIDTLEKEVKGPYLEEETYLAVVGVWSKEILGDWITTTKIS